MLVSRMVGGCVVVVGIRIAITWRAMMHYSILDDIIPAKILGISFIHIAKNVSKEKMTFFERKKAIVNSLDHAIKEFLRGD